MTADTIHTCSYECERPECIRAQRDELAARLTTETSNARGEWVLVPREPTQAMREAFNDWRPTEGNNYAGAQSFNAQERWAFRQRYAAMLAAAPPPAAIAALSAQQSPAEAQPVALLVRWQHGRKRLGITIADSVAAENYYHWRNGGENNQPVELLPLYTAPPSAPVGVEAVRGAWLAAITLANNICVQESDRENDRDGDTGWIDGTAECAKRIREYAHPTDAELLEMLDEAGANAAKAALAQQPAAVDRARFRKAPCYLCGYNGAGYFQPETHPCAALYHAAQPGGAE